MYAYEHGERHGVKGPTILNELAYFDLCNGFDVPDYLHSVLLGESVIAELDHVYVYVHAF